MGNGGFTFKIRRQFTFAADDHTLSLILGGLAKQEINITGYLQTKLLKTGHHPPTFHDDWNVVRVVVGSPDSESSSDLLGIRRVLEGFDVKFHEKSVIQVVDIPSGIPGVINSILGALWCNAATNAIYIGEETRIFVDPSDICEVLLILSHTPLQQCSKQCKPHISPPPEKKKKK